MRQRPEQRESDAAVGSLLQARVWATAHDTFMGFSLMFIDFIHPFSSYPVQGLQVRGRMHPVHLIFIISNLCAVRIVFLCPVQLCM